MGEEYTKTISEECPEADQAERVHIQPFCVPYFEITVMPFRSIPWNSSPKCQKIVVGTIYARRFEIRNLGHKRIAGMRDQDVGRFNITMYDIYQ
jgi:hypothetical protein